MLEIFRGNERWIAGRIYPESVGSAKFADRFDGTGDVLMDVALAVFGVHQHFFRAAQLPKNDFNFRRVGVVLPIFFHQFWAQFAIVHQHPVIQGISIAGFEHPILFLSWIEIKEYVFLALVLTSSPQAQLFGEIVVQGVGHKQDARFAKIGRSTRINPAGTGSVAVALAFAF